MKGFVYLVLLAAQLSLVALPGYADDHGDARSRSGRANKVAPAPKRTTATDAFGVVRLQGGKAVDISVRGRSVTQISVAVENVSRGVVHDVRIYIRGRAGVLLPLRGPSIILSRHKVLFTGSIRGFVERGASPHFTATCRECRFSKAQ